jgi:hypothetical protein
MQRSIAAAATSLFTLLCTFSTGVQASNYPPDYPLCSRRQEKESGPFHFVQRISNPYGKGFALGISYDGPLLQNHDASEIEFYVRINGNDAVLATKAGDSNDAYVFLNAGVRGCTFGHPSMNWQCEYPSDVENHLFFYTDDHGHMNNWDIEVAATAGGEWDSNGGANFKVTFENKQGC